MDIYEEAKARTSGVSPASRRLQLGLSAIVSRPDGAVVELLPHGTEVVLHPPTEPNENLDPKPSHCPQGPNL